MKPSKQLNTSARPGVSAWYGSYMASAFDVAAFIRREVYSLSRMKLHKLVYYAQAWSLVWDDEPLFRERIEAWERGPVVRELWAHEKHGIPTVGNHEALTQRQQETVLAVLDFYGKFDGDRLSEYTHSEAPWRRARAGLAPSASSQAPITHDSLREYYGAVVQTREKHIPHTYAENLRALVELPPELLDELANGPSLDTPIDVDVEGHLRWLETGSGEPWPASRN